jgi:hypothetical protein
MPDIVEITKDIINVQVSGTLLHDPVNISVSAPSEDPVIINVNDSQASVITVNGRNGYVTLNPSDVGLNSSNVVYTTGNQNIGGVKIFASRPTVNGTGVLLSGEATSLPTTIVYTTGDQTIGGYKNFNLGLQYKNYEVATLYDVTNQINQEINFTKYTYDRTVIQLGYANYIMGWNPLWDGQIPTGKNIQINLNNLNLTTYGNDGGGANINLPVTAPIDAKLRIFSNGDSGKSWSLNIYTTTGIFEAVTSTSPQNKRFIELIYNNGWKLNPIPWHLHTKAEITDLGEIPNIESGY